MIFLIPLPSTLNATLQKMSTLTFHLCFSLILYLLTILSISFLDRHIIQTFVQVDFGLKAGEPPGRHPLSTRCNLWFKHDDASPHFSLDVRQHFDDAFLNRLMLRSGSIATRWTIYFGIIYDNIYATPVSTVNVIAIS